MSGIRIQVSGIVDNKGVIKGITAASDCFGIFAEVSATIYNEGDGISTGVISGAIGIRIVNFNGTDDEFTNKGLIEGHAGRGVLINNGSNILITNTADGTYTGKITSTSTGIDIVNASGREPFVTNIGGSITGNTNGVLIQVKGEVRNYYNYASLTYGVITGTIDIGVRLNLGGLVDNEGTITGWNYGVYSLGNTQLVNIDDGTDSAIITGTSEWGVYIDGGANIFNSGGKITGESGVYVAWLDIDSIAGTDWQIDNSGTIEGTGVLTTGGDGLCVDDGGYIFISNNGDINAAKSGIYVGNGEIAVICNTGAIDCSFVGIWVDFYADEVYINNSGTIDAEYGIAASSNNGIYVDNSGIITATSRGIGLNTYGIVYNTGEITGTDEGIYLTDAGEVYNFGKVIGGNDGIVAGEWAWITNEGDGVLTGVIEGTNANGIVIGNTAYIFNEGLIFGGTCGIYLELGGVVVNYPGAEISGGTDGVYVDAGETVLTQLSLVTGNVYLADDPNYVFFGVDSNIAGDFDIGSNLSALLVFVGDLDIASLLYATVTGAADIGNKVAEVEIDTFGLPAGLKAGDKIVLIDGSSGGLTGEPSNDTFIGGAYKFKIYVENDQLIAEFIPSSAKDYYITATADDRTSISPDGKKTYPGGSDAKFTFTAKDGSFIGAVIVDGVYQPQSVIDQGFYVFRDVNANHVIEVKSRDPRTGMTLKITVAEGKGHAEYSVNGGDFAKYTSPVALLESSVVTVRAVADKGYEFEMWMDGGVEITSWETVFNMSSRGANVDISVYFSSSDDSGWSGSDFLLTYGTLIILILLVVIVLFFLLRKKDD
jgi:hypothetical protein